MDQQPSRTLESTVTLRLYFLLLYKLKEVHSDLTREESGLAVCGVSCVQIERKCERQLLIMKATTENEKRK